MEPGQGRDSEPLLVVSRRTARRIGLALLAVVVLAGVGVGAYLAGRSSTPKASPPNGGASTRGTVSTTTTAPLLKTFLIPSTAMYPTLKSGDRIVVDESALHTHPLKRGDIVVFRTPPSEEGRCGGAPVADIVKRIIGMPNETISAKGGVVYVTGKPLSEPWLPKVRTTYTANFGPEHIPKGAYFVMGDNRVNSCDSRSWGPVSGSAIVGKVVKIIQGSTTSTTSSSTTSTTAAPPTTSTTSPQPLPLVTNCGQTPTYEPTDLHWCSSECSSYMTDITWNTWGPNTARGSGTFVTKTTTPRTGETFVPCSTATPVQHPGTPAVLSDPQYVTVCPSGASPRQVLVFTKASWWTQSTYALVPQSCP